MITNPINRNIRNLLLGINPDLIPVAFTNLQVSATSQSIQAVVRTAQAAFSQDNRFPNLFSHAEITYESSASGVSARYKIGGPAPTNAAGNGIPLTNGDSIILTNADAINTFQIIQTQAGTHWLNITLYMKPGTI